MASGSDVLEGKQPSDLTRIVNIQNLFENLFDSVHKCSPRGLGSSREKPFISGKQGEMPYILGAIRSWEVST